MSKSLHTVEIDGYGPVTVRGLSKGRVKQIRRIETDSGRAAEVVKRGLVDPPLTHQVADELGHHMDALFAITDAILEHSWPNEASG